MSATVLVRCRECGDDARFPVCGWCLGQGHEAVDRTPTGDVPVTFEDGTPCVEWIPPLLGPAPRG